MENKNGITLIALIITIIVILIIAGVAIRTATGNDGIITKAMDAGKRYKASEKAEIMQSKLLEMTDENG